MPRRYPEYQEGGQVPTDIQRLIKRMMEAKTDRAEEVIPDMAYGGIVALQGGGMPPSSGTAATTRALMEFAKRGGLSDQDRLMMDFERMMEDSIESRSRRAQQKFDKDAMETQRKLQSFAEEVQGGLDARLSGTQHYPTRRPGGGDYWEEGRASGGIIGLQAGGSPYQQQMVQSYVSPEVAQPYADLTSRIQQVGGRAYTPYGGQRLAATTGDQALSRAAYGAYGRGAGPAGTGQAAATMGQAGRMIGGAQQGLGNVASKFGAFAPLAQQQAQAGAEGMRGVGEQAGSPEMQREADLSQYMSQYTQGAIDPQIRQIQEQAAAQRAEIGAQAAGAQAFGGYRHGLQEQAAGQEAQQRMQDVTAKGYEKAFQDAVKGFQTDRSAQAAGYGQQLEAQRGAGALEQQGFDTMGNLLKGEQGAYGQMGGLGSQMGQLGTAQQNQAQTEQQMQFARLQEMEKAGARTQQDQQRDYDIAYADFQRQQQHPQQMVDWQLGAMGQLPYQNTQVIGEYGQAPSVASDVAGALGAYSDWQSGGDAAAGETAPQPGAEVPQGVTDTTGTDATGTQENPDPEFNPDAGLGVDEMGNPITGAHGGYLSSSGILAPYHKKLIDGLYAGGRINY
tara:strand:+ start:537 stop:2390 length:1854 start_codon:yes stop_codon:yes gene_type:complete